MTTPNLQLPEVPRAILGASDELNDAFWSLDAVVQLAVKDKDLTTPPLDAVQGDRFIVPQAALGSWSGRGRSIAYLGPQGYQFFSPRPGWRARVLDENAWYVFTSAGEWEIEEGGGGSAAPINPDTPPETSNPVDDEFQDGTSIDLGGSREGGGHIPWSWFNQGGATADLSQGSLILTAPASNSPSFRIVEQPSPGSAWKIRAKIFGFYPEANFAYCGLIVRNTANSRLLFFGPVHAAGNFLYSQRWSSETSHNANIVTGPGISRQLPVYLEVELTSTDVIFRYSFTGFEGTYVTHTTESIGSFLSAAPTTVGLAANSQNNFIARCCVDWFRRVA